MYLQTEGDLKTVHNDQLVYLNYQVIALILFIGFKIWMVQNCETGEYHLNIKIVTPLILYNACTLWKYLSQTIINLSSIPGERQPLKKGKVIDSVQNMN